MSNWSPQQDRALREVGKFLRDPRQQIFRLFGYAGTGKTTLARELANSVVGTVLFAAYTGKAAHVLRQKGCTDASTIHSLIYKLEDENRGNPTWKRNPDSDIRHASLVIIDECSMVDEEIGRDLLSYGTKILVLGDPGQLPPVKGEGFFTAARPDVLLTEIHRQARDNPIIRLATDVREGRELQRGDYGAVRIVGYDQIDTATVTEADQCLCGKNATRLSNNRHMRVELGLDTPNGDVPHPVQGERLVCLRNNKEKGTLNGSLWTVLSSYEEGAFTRMSVAPEDGGSEVSIRTRNEFFLGREKDLEWFVLKRTDQFTYGYFLTVHKAQGSQWDNVVLFDESSVFRSAASNWLYTGITRAAKQLTVVV